MSAAADNLRTSRRQIDMDGCEVGVSRQALDETLDELDAMRASLRAIRNHWNEFGPEHGFEETLERACKPIDINKGEGSIWAALQMSPTTG